MRTHLRYRSILTVLLALLLVAAYATESTSLAKITVRDLEPHTILYTIHRGSYRGLGQAYGKLYGLAGAKGLRLTGEGLTVHLNNARKTPEAHLLTEVRLAVPESALNLAGTLGSMTDIKSVPAMQVAVAVKPAGTASPKQHIKTLYHWIYQNGYTVIDAPMQRVIKGAQTHDYTQMEVELLVPIAKPEDLVD